MIGWRVRANLALDNLGTTSGVSGDPARADNIVYDIGSPTAGGFGHPTCIRTGDQTQLPTTNH
jgi:hypothetical protein